MTTTKKTKTNVNTRVVPVVEQVEHHDCGCGCEGCTCGDSCTCASDKRHLVILQILTLLLSAIVVFGTAWAVYTDYSPFAHSTKIVHSRRSDNEIRDFIMKNPTVILDSVENFYKQQRAKSARPTQVQKAPADLLKKIVEDKTNYSMGNPKGKYVIVEFFDYNCGWCKKTNKAIGEAIAKKEASNIRWILIDTPIFGEASATISRYVLAAGEQGKFVEMHKAVVAANKQVQEADLIEMAKKLKLDVAKLKKDAAGKKIKDKLADNREYSQKLNISGVPMLIVDGDIHPGALFGEALENAVKASQKK